MAHHTLWPSSLYGRWASPDVASFVPWPFILVPLTHILQAPYGRNCPCRYCGPVLLQQARWARGICARGICAVDLKVCFGAQMYVWRDLAWQWPAMACAVQHRPSHGLRKEACLDRHLLLLCMVTVADTGASTIVYCAVMECHAVTDAAGHAHAHDLVCACIPCVHACSFGMRGPFFRPFFN